ncbi:MAG: hypothetical protein H0X34_14090 [Chthoniobacterales bacterium]|nr:hypothetical protein [Chthoniobacterales bacterium]
MNTKQTFSESGIFNPRILAAFALCSIGLLLGVFSVAATQPVKPARTVAVAPLAPASFLSAPTPDSKTNRLLPGVPLPPGAQFSVDKQDDDPSNSSRSARFSRVAGMPLRPGMPDQANVPGNPIFATSQRALLSAQPPLAQENVPLAGATAGEGWSIFRLLNIPWQMPNFLNGVTCLSESDCWAVGYYATSSGEQTLIEHWDGISWTTIESPNTSPVQGNLLTAVSCTSASDCWAVGFAYIGTETEIQTLTEHWDGTAWAIVASPNVNPGLGTYDNVLSGVTCASGTECWAVGYHANDTAFETLIERWDGTAWTIVSSPDLGATVPSLLSGATCVSGTDCWAVGYYYTESGYGRTLIEHWDGTSWTVATSANTDPLQGNFLYDVTCVSGTDCWAVGYYADYSNGITYQTLTTHWDGTSWAIVASPSIPGYNVLTSVTCASASNCWAVGYAFSGSDIQTVTERWDGISWTIPNSLDTPGNDSFGGVTCVSASECLAVGYQAAGVNGLAQTLIKSWDGTRWAIATSPNSGRRRQSVNVLKAATCLSTSNCWAVGYYSTPGAGTRTLIEHWDGTLWSVISSPSTDPFEEDQLLGVTCTSASDCWAVGYAFDGNSETRTLVERWDGTSWAIVASPNTLPAGTNFLASVTCTSNSECWAVGNYYNDSTGFLAQTLIEHWDGAFWTIVSSPNVVAPGTGATQINRLYGVTCSSALDCWAVGSYSDELGQGHTLIERWNGASWAIVSSPNFDLIGTSRLAAVTCASASDCWAVGYRRDATTQIQQTFIERWDGTSWAIVDSPNTNASGLNLLSGVTCASASNCWAVGEQSDVTDFSGGILQTLIEHWDGSSWTIVSSANTSSYHNNLLLGVACGSALDCWAVGSFVNRNGIDQALIEHYIATAAPKPTNVVSPKAHALAGF